MNLRKFRSETFVQGMSVFLSDCLVASTLVFIKYSNFKKSNFYEIIIFNEIIFMCHFVE